MVAMAVVVAVGLILYLLSVPPYYELKLTRERGYRVVTSKDHQLQGKVKMGLEYSSNWRANHWGTNFLTVRINCSSVTIIFMYQSTLTCHESIPPHNTNYIYSIDYYYGYDNVSTL